MLSWMRALAVSLALVAAAPAVAKSPAQPHAQDGLTPLDRYVHAPDPAYGWKLVGTYPGADQTTYVLELKSQTWRSAKEVDKPVWVHWLTIVKPKALKSSTALLVIGGGDNTDPAPAKASERTMRIAMETHTAVAELSDVPNQPLRFADSPEKARVEDDIIAYSRVKHFTTKDDTWLVRLAMVKSGVRAMDAVQAFLGSEAGGRTKIDHFVVSGGSKRGWTTWLVGATDNRVVAIIPIVIDALNSEAITRHHFEAYGFFSSALDDYVNHGLFPGKIGTPEYQAVLKIEDPYNYLGRTRLKMPKMMIDAAGDQFFLPDGSQFYWDKVQPEKHIRYVPNAKHNLAGSDSVETLIAFYDSVVSGRPRPRFDWTRQPDGTLLVKPVDKPKEVRLWQATNPKARDFRLDVIGPAYTSTVLKARPDGTYVGRAAKPASGWTAYFVELTYENGSPHPLKSTTQVVVTPDVLPYRWEDAAKKYPPKS
ncbi:MAG: PhoPQ-activated pathogenicity-related family protein [Phenylobacterium sp.]